MKTIHKFQVDLRALDKDNGTYISVPFEHNFVSAKCQIGGAENTVQLWAMVETDSPTVRVRVYVVGTGHDITNLHFGDVQFLASVQDPRGFIWHVFVSNIPVEVSNG